MFPKQVHHRRRNEYLFAVFGSAFIPVIIYLITGEHIWTTLACGIYFLSFPAIKIVLADSSTDQMNKALGLTVQMCLIYCAVFSLGLLLR